MTISFPLFLSLSLFSLFFFIFVLFLSFFLVSSFLFEKSREILSFLFSYEKEKGSTLSYGQTERNVYNYCRYVVKTKFDDRLIDTTSTSSRSFPFEFSHETLSIFIEIMAQSPSDQITPKNLQ